MEQYSTQPIVIEPAKKKPIGVQVAALVLGIVGAVFSYIAYFGTIISNAVTAYASENLSSLEGAGAVSGVAIAVDIFLAVLCLVGLILGIVGLVRSIRRETRTVKGIVMSAVGLSLAETGLPFAVLGIFMGGIFRVMINLGVFH